MTTHVRLCLTDHRNPQLDRSLLDWCGKQHCVSRESKRVWHHAQRGLLFYIESWFPMEPPNLLSEFKTRYVSCGSPSVDYVEPVTADIWVVLNKYWSNCCGFYLLQAEWKLQESLLPESWPNTGNIQFEDYGLQYRKGLDWALKDISINIQNREKVSKDTPSLQKVIIL